MKSVLFESKRSKFLTNSNSLSVLILCTMFSLTKAFSSLRCVFASEMPRSLSISQIYKHVVNLMISAVVVIFARPLCGSSFMLSQPCLNSVTYLCTLVNNAAVTQHILHILMNVVVFQLNALQNFLLMNLLLLEIYIFKISPRQRLLKYKWKYSEKLR